MCFNLVCLVLTTASPHRVYVFNTILASHIDTTALSDGTYKLIPDSEGGDLEAQVNTAVLTETPDQSLEEPKAVLASNYHEGEPRTQPSISNYYNLSLLLTCAFIVLRI